MIMQMKETILNRSGLCVLYLPYKIKSNVVNNSMIKFGPHYILNDLCKASKCKIKCLFT